MARLAHQKCERTMEEKPLNCPTPSSSFNGVEENPTNSEITKNKTIAAVIFLFAANFLIWITASSSGPYFAIVATERKGQTIGQVGLGNGIPQLFMAIFAPLCGKYLTIIRDDVATSLGLLFFSFSTFWFGLCHFLPPGWPFFYGIMVARILGSIGICAIVTSAWAILGRIVSERISMLRGIGELVNGIGFSLGPLLGSWLYRVGGFVLPSMVTGSVIGLVAILSFGLRYLIEKPAQKEDTRGFGHDEKPNKKRKEDEETEKDAEIGIFQLLRIPHFFLCIFSLLLMSIGWFFFEPSLPSHLATFHDPPKSSEEIATLMGWMMTVFSAVYALFAPIWGWLFERYFVHQQKAIMIIGSFGLAVCILLMGPSPLLGLQKSVPLLFLSFVMNGIFSAIVCVPMFRWCQEAAKERGFDEKSSAINGLIAGIHHSTFSFGAFLGTSVGGFSAENFGFAWTATGAAALQTVYIFLQLINALHSFCRPKKR